MQFSLHVFCNFLYHSYGCLLFQSVLKADWSFQIMTTPQCVPCPLIAPRWSAVCLVESLTRICTSNFTLTRVITKSRQA